MGACGDAPVMIVNNKRMCSWMSHEKSQDVFQLVLLAAQLGQLLLDLDRFQARQLAQADLEDVLGLAVRQAELFDQRRLRLIRIADDGDHLVDVQQDDLAAFEDVDAVVDLAQLELGAAPHRREADNRSIPG